MVQEEVTQIMVGKHRSGIIGLKSVLEEVSKSYADKFDDEIKVELLKRLDAKNYISNPALYGEAFLREFKKFIGKPVIETVSDGLHIKILGSGCDQCETLKKDVISVLEEMNLIADVEHVKDIKEIGQYCIMGVPALVINNKLVSAGSVPSKNMIKSLLTKFVK